MHCIKYISTSFQITTNMHNFTKEKIKLFILRQSVIKSFCTKQLLQYKMTSLHLLLLYCCYYFFSFFFFPSRYFCCIYFVQSIFVLCTLNMCFSAERLSIIVWNRPNKTDSQPPIIISEQQHAHEKEKLNKLLERLQLIL